MHASRGGVTHIPEYRAHRRGYIKGIWMEEVAARRSPTAQGVSHGLRMPRRRSWATPLAARPAAACDRHVPGKPLRNLERRVVGSVSWRKETRGGGVRERRLERRALKRLRSVRSTLRGARRWRPSTGGSRSTAGPVSASGPNTIWRRRQIRSGPESHPIGGHQRNGDSAVGQPDGPVPNGWRRPEVRDVCFF